MAASLHATNVISINRPHRRIGTRPHRKLVISPGARKVIPMTRMKEARKVRVMERGSGVILVAASLAAAFAIARFYLAKSTLIAPVAGMPTTW